MNTKNELTNGSSSISNNNSNYHAHLHQHHHLQQQQHQQQHHNHLHPQHPHQHPNHQHHLLTSANGSSTGGGGSLHLNGLVSGNSGGSSNPNKLAISQYGQQQHQQHQQHQHQHHQSNGLNSSHANNSSTGNNLYINNQNSNVNSTNSNSSNSNSNNNSSSGGGGGSGGSGSTNLISNSLMNSGSNSGSNGGNEADYAYKSQLYAQPPPQWYDVDIKGMVKNISPKLWQWTHLSRLCLNDNNLVRLPPVVSNLTNLHYLDVSNNKIRTLPAEIGDMTSLRELYLNFNQLRVLPFELGKLFKLHQLGLKGNPLTSDIMQIYSEPNGTQKLLISLLDQLSITCTPPPRRPWMILAEPSASMNSCIFTTMCYNVLCDKYATRQYYGYCPAWALAWDYRKKLILDDIKTFNADIIALQELETEQFYQFFLPELKQCDYDGIFSPKSRAKTMSEHEKKHVDGCAIFFKTTRFQLVKDYLIEFNQIAMATAEGSEDMLNRVMTKDNIGLAALLEVKQDESAAASSAAAAAAAASASGDKKQEAGAQHAASQSSSSASSSASSSVTTQQGKQLLLVSTAHIHWDPEYCDVKLIQTLMFTNELKMIIEQAAREFQPQKYANGGQNVVVPVDCSVNIPVVVCADLNSLPDSGVIEYLRTGRIHANHTDFKELGYDSCLQKINMSDKPSELSHNLKLDCAYDKDLMPYTNYTYDFKGMIDYIFYSSQLMRTVGLLGPLDIDWLKANKIVGFPHPHVPSDHLPLMVELELINPNSPHSNNNNNNHNTNANSAPFYSSNNSNGGYSSGSTPTSNNYQSSSSGSSLLNRSTNHHHSHSSHHTHSSNNNSNNNNANSNNHHHHHQQQHHHSGSHHNHHHSSNSLSQNTLVNSSSSSSSSSHMNHQNSNQSSNVGVSSPSNNLLQLNSSNNNNNNNFNYLRK